MLFVFLRFPSLLSLVSHHRCQGVVLTYSLVNGFGDINNDMFAITGTTVRVSAAAVIAVNTLGPLRFLVQVSDGLLSTSMPFVLYGLCCLPRSCLNQ